MISESTIRSAIGATPADDDIAVALTAAVIRDFEALAGRPYKRTVNGQALKHARARSAVLWLPGRPVESVSLVEERGLSDSTWTTLTTDLYVVEGARLERLAGYFSMHIRVTYTFGYTQGATGIQNETPPDIVDACVTQAKFLLARFTNDRVAATQQSTGKATVNLEPGTYHPRLIAVAERYRNTR